MPSLSELGKESYLKCISVSQDETVLEVAQWQQKETKEEEEEDEDDDRDDDSLCTDVPPPSEKIGREGETSVHRRTQARRWWSGKLFPFSRVVLECAAYFLKSSPYLDQKVWFSLHHFFWADFLAPTLSHGLCLLLRKPHHPLPPPPTNTLDCSLSILGCQNMRKSRRKSMITRTLANSNLALTRSNFQFPLDFRHLHLL